jgi:hypothetical protein
VPVIVKPLLVATSEEPVKHLQPHPEERRIFAARLEGWQRATEIGCSRFRRSFVPKSGRPDFGAVRPSFETAAHRNRLLPISTL